MAYKKIKSYKMTEEELRNLWKNTYCNPDNPIYTFDNILVKFYKDMFDHAFFESSNWKRKDKSILSLNRCEKMLWIKDTLQDTKAIIKQGWDKNNKTYNNSRRVAMVKDNYVVVIRFIKRKMAKFVTSYQIDDEVNLQKYLNSPDWNGEEWL